MAQNLEKARAQWERYQYMRDYGHQQFVEKADKCEDFFIGLQWSKDDLNRLKQVQRPALTINKIISTLSTVFGEQIYNRSEISFAPRTGGTAGVAEALTRLFMQIGDANQLSWVRSDVFADGIIRSRGFYDLRLAFDDNMRGEARITKVNPKNVLIDPDAEEYDPDEWEDVFISKWISPNTVEAMYGKDVADELRARKTSAFQYGFDSLETRRERFQGVDNRYGYYSTDLGDQMRYVRCLDRQYREVTEQLHFVDPVTGDARAVPDGWDRNKIAQVREKYQLQVIRKVVKRIKWCVTLEDQVVHDKWSPYKHFTVIPYFPFFRYGKTVGLVENLLGPQELLNKTTSQELHVVNTTANSGWKLKEGSLRNMSIEELEARGAQTGIVLELDDIANADKIQPNQIPSGLERMSFKAEEFIKNISNVSDSLQGFDREDVAAKAIQAKQQRGSVNFSKVLDNLNRTDYFLARNMLDLIQEYYTEERILNVTTNRMTGEQQPLELNVMTPEGEIVNDLTIGEYDIIVLASPERETFEDTQFEQAARLKELGIQLPDSILIENSRLLRKGDVLKQIEEQANSPEAQQQKALQLRMAEAQVMETESNAMKNRAAAQREVARAQAEIQKMADGGNEAMVEFQLERFKAEQEAQLAREKQEGELELAREKMLAELELQREKMQGELRIKADAAKQDAMVKRAQVFSAGAGASTVPQ